MRFSIYYILILIFLFSCEDKKFAPVMAENGKRLVLAYLGGDNSLSDEIEGRMEALEEGFRLSLQSDPNDVLLIFQDSKDKPSCLTEISAMGTRESQLLPSENLDSSDPEVLQTLIEIISHFYSADSYGLIVFSHGSAWMPESGLQMPELGKSKNILTRSVVFDHENEMELNDFAQSLILPEDKKWDFILFENCYMGSVEVAYELKDIARRILASPTEVLSPGMVEIYRNYLPLLFHEKADLEDFARAYFDLYNSKTGSQRSATVCVMNTDRMEELANLAVRVFDGYQPDEKTLNEWQHFNRSGNSWKFFFDLEQMMVEAQPECQEELSALLSDMITYKAATGKFAEGDYHEFVIDHFCGLSCYYPQDKFKYLNDYYYKTAWGKKVFKSLRPQD